MDGIPEDFCFDKLPEDIDHFEPILESAIDRMPMLATPASSTFFNGPESFTPDDRYLLGETPEVRDLFVASGFNSIGIQSSGGAGMVLAQWIRDGHPPFDLSDVDIRRLIRSRGNRATCKRPHGRERSACSMPCTGPTGSTRTARGVRRSPLPRPAEGARRRVSARSPAGSAPTGSPAPGVEPEYRYSWGRQNWFDHMRRANAEPCANAVGLFDQSSLRQVPGRGPRRLAVLQPHLAPTTSTCAGPDRLHAMAERARRHRGRPHRHAPRRDRFLVVTGAAAADPRPRLAASAISRTRRAAVATDVTSGLPMLCAHGAAIARAAGQADRRGPLQRSLPVRHLARDRDRLCPGPGEPHHLCRRAGLGALCPGRIRQRTSSTPIVAAGHEFGLSPAGMHTMNNCRIEKAYRHWGHDIADEDTPLEAGLGFCLSPGTSPAASSAGQPCSSRRSSGFSPSAWSRSGSRIEPSARP